MQYLSHSQSPYPDCYISKVTVKHAQSFFSSHLQMFRICFTEFVSIVFKVALTSKIHSCLKEQLVYSDYNQTILVLVLGNEVCFRALIKGKQKTNFPILFSWGEIWVSNLKVLKLESHKLLENYFCVCFLSRNKMVMNIVSETKQ